MLNCSSLLAHGCGQWTVQKLAAKLTRSVGLQTDPVTVTTRDVVECCSMFTQTDVEDVKNEEVSTQTDISRNRVHEDLLSRMY